MKLKFTCIGLSLLKFSKLHPIFHLWMHHYKSFIYTPCTIYFLVSELHVNVGMPSLFIWLPFHPSFKYLPCASNISKHLFHVGVFVPVLSKMILLLSSKSYSIVKKNFTSKFWPNILQTGYEKREIKLLDGDILINHKILPTEFQGNIWQLDERVKIRSDSENGFRSHNKKMTIKCLLERPKMNIYTMINFLLTVYLCQRHFRLLLVFTGADQLALYKSQYP